ncbi:unnamed protein product, partial [Amoebophrya sp. A25]|eukprot:GSA25T00016156001.1
MEFIVGGTSPSGSGSVRRAVRSRSASPRAATTEFSPSSAAWCVSSKETSTSAGAIPSESTSKTTDTEMKTANGKSALSKTAENEATGKNSRRVNSSKPTNGKDQFF